MTEIRKRLIHIDAAKLARYCDNCLFLGIDYADEELSQLVNDLEYIDEALFYEESNNLGLSKTAHYHRKRWRKLCRQAEKWFKRRIKNHILYTKEWSKPRQVYISDLTGECHNGLWWTFRACLSTPILFKCKFRKVKGDK